MFSLISAETFCNDLVKFLVKKHVGLAIGSLNLIISLHNHKVPFTAIFIEKLFSFGLILLTDPSRIFDLDSYLVFFFLQYKVEDLIYHQIKSLNTLITMLSVLMYHG